SSKLVTDEQATSRIERNARHFFRSRGTALCRRPRPAFGRPQPWTQPRPSSLRTRLRTFSSYGDPETLSPDRGASIAACRGSTLPYVGTSRRVNRKMHFQTAVSREPSVRSGRDLRHRVELVETLPTDAGRPPWDAASRSCGPKTAILARFWRFRPIFAVFGPCRGRGASHDRRPVPFGSVSTSPTRCRRSRSDPGIRSRDTGVCTLPDCKK